MSDPKKTVLGGMRGFNASALFYDELPAEQQPTSKERALDVAMIWGDTIIEAVQLEAGSLSIGSGDGNGFKVYIEDVDQHVLATVEGEEAHLSAPAGGEIILRKDGRDRKAGSSATIGLHDRARIKFGAVEFVVRFMRPEAATRSGLLEGMDLYFTKVLSMSSMVAVVILAMLMITPTSKDLLSDDLFQNNSRISQILLHPPEPSKPMLDLSGVESGETAAEPEGVFGQLDAVKKKADPSKEKAKRIDADQRARDQQAVLGAGILGVMGSNVGAYSDVFNPGGLGGGINDALGALTAGAGLGDAHGTAGLSSRGSGPGGSGNGSGFGIGNLGTGSGKGGPGSLNLNGSGRGGVTKILAGETKVVGSLSKEVIGEVIRRHSNQIKSCYEKELQKDPSLQGKVEIYFVIDSSGAVSEAKVSQDLGSNRAVSSCMVSRIGRWRFPEPKGGGQVIVTYPWIFRAAGAP